VEQAGMVRIFKNGQAAARFIPPFNRQGFKSGAGQISLKDQAVMTRSQDNRVVGFVHLGALFGAGRTAQPDAGRAAAGSI
jgi:hypothetical protein